EEGALSLWIINRTREKAQELAKEVSRFYPETKVRALTYDELDQLPQERMIALQCTSVGLHPHCEETPVEAEDFFRRIDYAFDLIYRPEETAFLRRVRQAGGRTANGLAMLLWQGIAAYEYWNDVAVEPQEAQKLLKQLKEAIGQ
ncbi:MAG: shikimate dehydrogenase, partial [Eubacteriales bacterium]|nr:shikimate dehydrogenase [Eubacteriales bacterium]